MPLDAPLQFLRDWLPFGHRRAGGHSGDDLRAWLDGLVDASPEVIAGALVARMPSLIAEEQNLHLRVKILDALFAEALRIAPSLESAVHDAPLPLPAQIKAKALVTDNLFKVLSSGYNSVITGIEMQHSVGGLTHLLQHVVLNMLQVLSRRQQLAYRAYAPASESTWRKMHRSYRIAREKGVSGVGIPAERIDTYYLGALLLAFADPSRFSRGAIDQLAAACRHFASSVRVLDPGLDKDILHSGGRALFVVGAGDHRPGRIKVSSDTAFADDDLVIDCDAVVTLLQQEVDRLETSPPNGAAESPLNAVGALLPGLLGSWEGVPGRRFSRQRFKPRADLISGIDDLNHFVIRSAFRRRRDDRVAGEVNGICSEWSVIDESPDGFGVRHVRGEMRPIEVGEIIGLRTREESRVHICLVRRVSNLGPTRLEVGLQTLSARAIGISIPDAMGKPSQGLLLPSLPGFGGAGAIVAAPGLLRRGATLPQLNPRTASRRRIGKSIESNRRCEVFLIEHHQSE